MAKINKVKPDYIFETSWEVCNKVGGIYTVLSTKAKTLQDLYKDKIWFIGPDCWQEKNNPDFIESSSLLKDWKKHARESEQLSVRVGRWNIPGKPIAILVDYESYYTKKDEIYFRVWKSFGVNSMRAYGDYDESCMFAYATGLVMESLYHFFHMEKKQVVAHFNEWMLGMGALYIQGKVPAIATIFTTHATSIGRSIAGNDKPLYSHFQNYNGDQMAAELNMEAKHSIEKQTALHVDCFTTVSDITACECAQLLERIPDVVTPNGFESNFVPQGNAFNRKRKMARKALIRVAEQLTGESIPDQSLLLAISGRYEYKNKGIDVFIEAMNRVRLTRPDKPIVAFILVPAWANGARPDLKKRLEQNEPVTNPLPDPYYTHELYEPQGDKICNYLRHLNFLNQPSDHLKLIFVPSYLNGNDGIFNLTYYDLLTGLDLTVFPSYYEPWGYTPLESIAFSVPTITTNLAGFGLWAIKEGCGDNLFTGVEVLKRSDENYFEVAEKIKESILVYNMNYDAEKIHCSRQSAHSLSEKASWSHFISYYLEAYDIALKNAKKRVQSIVQKKKNNIG